jgi:hypothetical protein
MTLNINHHSVPLHFCVNFDNFLRKNGNGTYRVVFNSV